MAYNVIFTVSGAGSDTGPFDISGTTSGGITTLIESGVAKATLEAGYEVTIPNSNITGGTVASIGTCTTSQPWTKPTIALSVFAKDVNGGSIMLIYNINGGGNFNFYNTNENICSDLGAITGLTEGDTVTFSTAQSYVMNGADNTTTCPNSSGSATTYTTTIGSTSPDTVAITINSGFAP